MIVEWLFHPATPEAANWVIGDALSKFQVLGLRGRLLATEGEREISGINMAGEVIEGWTKMAEIVVENNPKALECTQMLLEAVRDFLRDDRAARAALRTFWTHKKDYYAERRSNCPRHYKMQRIELREDRQRVFNLRKGLTPTPSS